MLFCNLTPLDGRFVNAIVFCRKSEFCEHITSLHIQHSIFVRQFEFFVFTMQQIASIFCNVSFAVQYIYIYIENKTGVKAIRTLVVFSSEAVRRSLGTTNQNHGFYPRTPYPELGPTSPALVGPNTRDNK